MMPTDLAVNRGGDPATEPIHHWFVEYSDPMSMNKSGEPSAKTSGHSIMVALTL